MTRPKRLNFKCKHTTCENPKHFGLGYCKKHHRQFRLYGKTTDRNRKSFNIVNDYGNYVGLVLEDNEGKPVAETFIDKEDLPLAKAVGKWCLGTGYKDGKRVKGYAVNGNTSIGLHRIIMQANVEEQVDHVKTGLKSTLDNRKKNLRKCTHSQNNVNKGLQSNNKSGFKGVYKDKVRNKWVARIQMNREVIFIGRYDLKQDAINAYLDKAKIMHKEYMHATVAKQRKHK